MSDRAEYIKARAANPWGLTLAEAKAMDAYIEAGCQKVAADRLGMGLSTLQLHMCAARKKIGGRSQIKHVLQWDRWRRTQ